MAEKKLRIEEKKLVTAIHRSVFTCQNPKSTPTAWRLLRSTRRRLRWTWPSSRTLQIWSCPAFPEESSSIHGNTASLRTSSNHSPWSRKPRKCSFLKMRRWDWTDWMSLWTEKSGNSDMLANMWLSWHVWTHRPLASHPGNIFQL